MMIDLDIELFGIKQGANPAQKVAGIDENNIRREIALTKSDMILVPLLAIMMEFGI